MEQGVEESRARAIETAANAAGVLPIVVEAALSDAENSPLTNGVLLTNGDKPLVNINLGPTKPGSATRVVDISPYIT